MKTNKIFLIIWSLTVVFLVSCAQHAVESPATKDKLASTPKEIQKKQNTSGFQPINRITAKGINGPNTNPNFKPQITWKPTYSLSEIKLSEKEENRPEMIVGAKISTKNGKVPLHSVIKTLADLKGMNVSWSSDVDQEALVNVSIKPESNFWDALNEVLRQVDYFYEFKNNTIIVKYKDTQRFYIPSPFLKGSYRTSVGGDFLGTANELNTGLQGELAVEHNDDNIDLWETIEQNISKILHLAAINVPETNDIEQQRRRILAQCRMLYPSDTDRDARDRCIQQRMNELLGSPSQTNPSSQNQTSGQIETQTAQGQNEAFGNREGFYYTIDKPLGIITVTAPRSILVKVKDYIDNLKKVLSRQVVIEAKILEVQLDDTDSKGIDWSNLLKDSHFNFHMTFGENGQIYPTDGIKFLESVTMTRDNFDLVVSFLNEFGKVNLLSNPKLSLLNGQPAMITGGRTTRYVDKVTTVVNNSNGAATTSYTIETRDILSGIGLGVIANISADDEIILQLTPVNSRLLDPENMKRAEFGSFLTGYARVDLPEVNLREMTTMARVKSGQLLVIGGIIDEERGTTGNKVPILGDIPVIGYAFKSEKKYVHKRELVILLRPQIVEL